MSAPSVLFVQMNSERAGASTALWRLLAQPQIRRLNPSIVTSGQGWLTEACASLGLPVFVADFPKLDSLWGRTAGLWSFSERLIGQIQQRGLLVQTVVGNDCSDGPFAVALAKALDARSALFVRSGDASEERLHHLRCAEADLLLPVGQRLFDLTSRWFPDADIKKVAKVLVDTDFREPKPQPEEFPLRLLVIGKDHPGGGWQDVIAACDLLSDRAPFAYLIVDVVGSQSQEAVAVAASRSYRINFTEPPDDFPEFVRRYDLVVNPSHHLDPGVETYEVLAAGVPVLTTGGTQIESLIDDDLWIFEPGHSTQIASKLTQLYQNWQSHSFPIEAIQLRLREELNVTPVAKRVARHLRTLALGEA
jgi:glycosyltransferase involved in cell wall biosynthesis